MPASRIRRLLSLFGWTRHSSFLLAAFLLVCGMIIYFWWPLAEDVLSGLDWRGQWWIYFDWLLLGIFTVMTFLIMARANLRTDLLIVFVAANGGLVFEARGTQNNLWFYYTSERPPLWIIPAWPIATLSIDRITRLFNFLVDQAERKLQGNALISKNPIRFKHLYWITFLAFYGLMLYFVAPTFHKTFTLGALLLCTLFILTPTHHRQAFLTFLAGSALGYFLELWGTTRQCWTYYTYQTPPLFAVLAHGMAAVAFWRAGLLVRWIWEKTVRRVLLRVRRTEPGS